MKILISSVFAVLFLCSFTFMTSSMYTPFSEKPILNKDAVVSIEIIEESEILEISSLMGGVEVVSATVFTEKSGQSFLEIVTKVDGKLNTLVTESYDAALVPPCRCSPGDDGVYDRYEGLTPYVYNQPYCLPCAVKF